MDELPNDERASDEAVAWARGFMGMDELREAIANLLWVKVLADDERSYMAADAILNLPWKGRSVREVLEGGRVINSFVELDQDVLDQMVVVPMEGATDGR